jgi:phosphate-selective porin OprO/OprP
MVNWHLTDNIRLELAYGYGKLDRFDVTGTTRFFNMRAQFTM